jgi:hypothetical protein
MEGGRMEEDRVVSGDALAGLVARRRERWGQTTATRAADPEAATRLVERLGVVTLFPASPEVPNVYHAYTGDATSKIEAEWDSDAGRVYTWRWELGRRDAAFYGVLVCGRPTLVSWALVPAVLRLRADLRMPDELFDLGLLSPEAYRVARALDAAGGPLSTGALRAAAGFPSGKEHRAAYLKAVGELDARLMLAKTFAQGDEDMYHALVVLRHADHAAAAERMTREAALDALLDVYLPNAVYAVPPVLARHLRLPEDELRAGFDRYVASGAACGVALPGRKSRCFVWSQAL